MSDVEKTAVELRIYSKQGPKDLVEQFFHKVCLVSGEAKRTLLKIGTEIPPATSGLKKGVVRNVDRMESPIQIWVETKSSIQDLLHYLPSAGWTQTLGNPR